uniref:Uncharacterized protein n=1 Tax=Klebsiella pneumoniae TaxID=573 RepID=A0A8B0ST73_KLEPN|nr:hypothetical protein [Klebsiella pneumoniae]
MLFKGAFYQLSSLEISSRAGWNPRPVFELHPKKLNSN